MGRRVLVSFIAAMALQNRLTPAEIAHEYTLPETEVLASLLYYREHQAEIDAQDAEQQRAWEKDSV